LVVGAGLSGAFAARLLADQGVDVTVLDKGSGPGGRLSVRRADEGLFVHGAPAIDQHDPRWARYAARWSDAGWLQGPGPRWAGEPPHAVVKGLLDGLPLRSGCRVERLERLRRGWAAWTADGERVVADDLILAVPAPQAAALLGDHPFAARLAACRYASAWVARLSLPVAPGPLATSPHATARGAGRAWVIEADAAWSAARIDDDADAVLPSLVSLARAMGMPEPVAAEAHRWRYARCVEGVDAECLVDRDLFVIGDAFGARDADGAVVSAMAAVGRWFGRSR
jgi:predicted NAD/FAD-dependent oxidoreductase